MKTLNKIVSIVAMAALLLVLVNSVFIKTTYAIDEYDTLRDKWKVLLTGGTTYNTSDPDIANQITALTATAQSNWSSMNTAGGRTYLWSDLASTTDSSHITGSYNRLNAMALAYATTGSTLQNNAALLADIISALDWMYTNRYNETKTEYNNWWDWEIGVPLALNDTVVMLYGQLTTTQITNYMNAIDHFQPTVTMTGANRVWESMIIAVRGIIVKNSAKIASGRDGLSGVFPYVTSSDGFYTDGSFIQHGNIAYTGAYGLALIQNVSKVIYVLSGSTWAVTDSNKQNVFKWVYDSFETPLYKGAFMDMANGRDISRAEEEDHIIGQTAIQMVILISQFASTTDAAAYKSMVKYWIQTDTYRNFYTYAPINSIVLGKAIVNDGTVTSRGELVKQKQFPSMDRAVQLRPGFGFGISMSSNRIANYESINNENLKGWYTGDGMTYLYDADFGQYSGGYWPTVNPYRLAGTTVDTQTRANASGENYLSSKNWVGGTSILDSYGVSGMELKAYGNTLTAKKSWFMLDNEVVALGAGITSTDGRTIESIVDNRKINSTGDNALTVNGTAKSTALGWSETMTGVNWIHLAGNVPGSDVGYYFPGSSTVKGIREARTGNWNAINSFQSTASITNNFINLWFDHGTSPTNGSYSYVILPNMTSTQVSAYAASPDITVLENSVDAQAVKENTLNVTGVNFWNDITKTVGIVTSNKKASVMTSETANDIEVTVSDPTQANTSTISIEINKSAVATISADVGITVTQLSPTIKYTVNVNGAKGKTFKAKFSYVALNNLALNKTVTASSTVSNTDWNVAKSVDGQRNSVSGSFGWTSNNNLTTNHTEWLQVDLGSTKTISKADLYPRNDTGNVGYGFPVDFTIQTSTDGINWSTVITQTSYALPSNAVQSFTFSATGARYVKVVGTSLRQNPSDSSLYRMQLAEIEIYSPVWYSNQSFSTGTQSLGSGHTGTVTMEYDVMPLANNIDGTTGYADSSTSVTGYSSLAMIVRMNTTGTFDVRNGTSYAALSNVSYSANSSYHVKIIADMSAKTYSVWVTSPGGSPVSIASNYTFRSDAPLTDDVGQISLISVVNNNEFKITNHTISP